MNIRQFKELYKKTSLPVKASIWYTVCSIVNKGIALFSTPIFTRVMTEDEYGLFTIFQSWYSIFIIFTSLNIFGGSYQKGLIIYKEDVDGYTSSQLGLTITITSLFLLIYLIFPEYWTEIFSLSPVLMIAMFAELYTMPALEFWSSRQRFDYKYKKYIGVTMLMSILSLGGGIVAVLNSSHRVEARVYTDMGAKVLCSGIILFVIFYTGKKFFDKKYWKYALIFNLPLIPHYLSNYILNQSDRLMISKMIGNKEAAYYSVAYTISTMMMLIVTAVNNSLIPFIYKSIDNGNKETIKKPVSNLIFLIAGLCVITMAFAPEVIWIFAGEKYLDAIYIIPPVSVSVFFIFLYSLFSTIEYFYEKTGQIAIATCISAVINLGLNYIFIKKYGYYAAGYTTLICYICLAIMHYIFYKKILKSQDKNIEIYDMKIINIISIIMILLMLVMTIMYSSFLVRYLFLMFIAVVLIINQKRLKKLLKELKLKKMN